MRLQPRAARRQPDAVSSCDLSRMSYAMLNLTLQPFHRIAHAAAHYEELARIHLGSRSNMKARFCYTRRANIPNTIVILQMLTCMLPIRVTGQNKLCATESNCNCSESAPTAAPTDSIEFNETTYEFFSTPATWCDAESTCRERSGNLPSILTTSENNIAVRLCNRNLPNITEQPVPLPNQACWIGLNDRDPPDQADNTNERNFQWSDGSAVNQTFISSMWHRTQDARYNQPDDKGQDKPEDCIFLYKPLPGWHDRDCDGMHMFICKVSSDEARKQKETEALDSPANSSTGTSPTNDSTGPAESTNSPSNLQQQGSTPAQFERLTATQIANIAGPTVSGVAGLIVGAYTAWKWYHKRKQTLVKLKTGPTSLDSQQSGVSDQSSTGTNPQLQVSSSKSVVITKTV